VPTIDQGTSRRQTASRLIHAGCEPGLVTRRFSRHVRRHGLIRLKTPAGTVLAHYAEVDAVFSKGRRRG
jgi:hypothetical protein